MHTRHKAPLRKSSKFAVLALASAALANVGAAVPAQAKKYDCRLYAPIQTFKSAGIYADKKGSIIDPIKLARNDRAMRPVRAYVYQVTTHTDRAFGTGDAAAGRCAAELLERWARADALSGPSESNETVYYKTNFIFALASAEHKLVAHDPRLRSPTVAAWLTLLARKNIIDFPRRHPPTGNLYYWTGAMAAATGSLAGDSRLLDYSNAVFRSAMGEVRHDGSLKKELNRAGRALGYHLFALKALIFIQLYRFDCFAKACSPGPLQRLIRFNETALIDTGEIARRAGATQQKPADNLLIELCQLPDRVRALALNRQCNVPPIDNAFGGNILLTITAAKDYHFRRCKGQCANP